MKDTKHQEIGSDIDFTTKDTKHREFASDINVTTKETKESWKEDFDELFVNLYPDMEYPTIRRRLAADDIKAWIAQERQALKQQVLEAVGSVKRPYDQDAIPPCQIGHVWFCDCDIWNEACDNVKQRVETVFKKGDI